ncbi:MAG: TIGR03067 domain-containing protein [Gemmataceae bacterium]|nr:TIGR03067 domain-containing protein [Gemmataceae bacterium]
MSARAALLFVAVLIAADVSAQDAKKELDKLQGEWMMFSREANGKKSDNTNWKLTIKGDQWTVTRPDGEGVAVQAMIKLDPSKEPKEIDLILKGDRSTRGIYKLEGDTLTFCRPGPSKNAERPKEFKTTDSPNEIIVWKRAEKRKSV